MSETKREPKREVWTRWGVTITASGALAIADFLSNDLPSGGRSLMRSMTYDSDHVWAVIEYRAKGANANDIRKMISNSVTSLERSEVDVRKIASFETEARANVDLLALVEDEAKSSSGTKAS